jgi:hypothetical protein
MLNTRDLADRQVIAAVREHDALCRRRYKIIKLDQPIQRGWRRLHVLSEGAVARRDRSILEAILAAIGSVKVHHNRDFRRRRGRRKKLVEIDQPLRPIPVHEWQRENYPNEWHRYFRYELILEWNCHWQPYWVFTQPSLYELKIERNWLWYFREVDPLIETRLSELDRWLEAREGWRRYGWLKGRPQSYRWKEEDSAKHRSLAHEHKREIARAYQTFPEVDPAASVRRIPISLWRTKVLFPGVAQCRGNELRPRRVRVQVLPPGPFFSNH